jgi:hypothetical protein
MAMTLVFKESSFWQPTLRFALRQCRTLLPFVMLTFEFKDTNRIRPP